MQPYLGTRLQLHLFSTSPGIPCTYCVCRNENHISARCRSSWPLKDVSHGSDYIRQHRSILVTDWYSTNHIEANDFTIGLFNLAELHQEVPESRLCNNSIGCKYTHPIELWRRVALARQMAANDLVFCKTTWGETVSALCSNTFPLLVNSRSVVEDISLNPWRPFIRLR